MSTPPTFEQLCIEFAQFRQVMNRTFARIEEGPVKQEALKLAVFLEQKFTEFENLYPQALTEFNQQVAQLQRSAEQTQRESADLQAQLAAKTSGTATPSVPTPPAAAASASTPTAPAFEPGWSTLLRNELVARFGASRKSAVKKREIWEDWDGWHPRS